MSYNPNRQKNALAKRQRKLDPRAGLRYSEVVSRFGPGAATIDDARSKVDTDRGWRVEIHKGDEFEMIYEFICSRNATGKIRNEDQDRAIRVLGGMVFLTIGSEVFELRAGSSYSFPKGVEYQLATSGDFDAEVIFCQGVDYEENIEQLTPPDLNAVTKTRLPTEPLPGPPRVDNGKAQEQAERIKARRAAREVRKKLALQNSGGAEEAASPEAQVKKTPPPRRGRAPLAAQQVVGVNPRPIGAGGYNE